MHSSMYKAIYDALQDGLYSFDKNGKVVQINKAATDILGFTEKELMGKVAHDMFHLHAFDEQQVSLHNCPIYQSFLEGKEYVSEEYFRKKDGSVILVEVSCSAIFEEDVPTGYVVLFRDITQKKKNQNRVLSLSKIVKESQDIIVIKDLNLKVLAANNAFVKASGRDSVEDLIGKTDAEIFNVSVESEPIKSYMSDERKAQKLSPGEQLMLEEPVIYPDGSTKYFRTAKFPIYDGDVVIATANISTDITMQKNYEKKLQKQVHEEIQKRTENELLYNKIFDTANLGICLTNTEGRFAAVNPEYCNIYGYQEDELIGKHFTIVVPDEHKESLSKLHYDFLIHEKEELSTEWTVIRKDGKHIRILASASRLENVVGGPYKITTVSDITEAYKTRELQQQQEALLIQQSKMAAMGEMLGAIAHQWRQPLNVINCTTLDMKLKSDLDSLDKSSLEKSLSDLENITQEMSRTIEDFMNFFKVDKKVAEFSIYECFNYALRIFEAQFKSLNITLHVEISKELVLNGIMGELEQVFLNFLSNSKDAFVETQVTNKNIKIYTQVDEKYTKIIYEDSAGGIDENILASIFNPYFTTKVKGTGIGLYMSSLIISNTFKGEIFANNIYEDKRRVGTKFLIEVPRRAQ